MCQSVQLVLSQYNSSHQKVSLKLIRQSHAYQKSTFQRKVRFCYSEGRIHCRYIGSRLSFVIDQWIFRSHFATALAKSLYSMLYALTISCLS